MLPNPFTPSRIANKPEEFFGRSVELSEIPRVIRQGSIVVDGPTGIGKSSLVSQIILALERGGSRHEPLAAVYPMVCHRSMKTPDDIAWRLLAELTDGKEKSKKHKFMVPKIYEMESTTTQRPADAARAIRAVVELLVETARTNDSLVVVALDEADKCAAAVAQFMRIVLTTTELEQRGLDRIRFVISGVSPFYNAMIEEDAGVARFIYQRYTLPPFDQGEAIEFLEEKFRLVVESPAAQEVDLYVDENLIGLVARVTGGHPHLLQLVGSYVIDHEDSSPDSHLSTDDLVGCFNRVCYQTRGPVYEAVLHEIALAGHLDAMKELFHAAEHKCPTSISTRKATGRVDAESLKYLCKTGLFTFDNAAEAYRLNDEFLRIRMLLDEPESNARILEKRLLNWEKYCEDKDSYE